MTCADSSDFGHSLEFNRKNGGVEFIGVSYDKFLPLGYTEHLDRSVKICTGVITRPFHSAETKVSHTLFNRPYGRAFHISPSVDFESNDCIVSTDRSFRPSFIGKTETYFLIVEIGFSFIFVESVVIVIIDFNVSFVVFAGVNGSAYARSITRNGFKIVFNDCFRGSGDRDIRFRFNGINAVNSHKNFVAVFYFNEVITIVSNGGEFVIFALNRLGVTRKVNVFAFESNVYVLGFGRCGSNDTCYVNSQSILYFRNGVFPVFSGKGFTVSGNLHCGCIPACGRSNGKRVIFARFNCLFTGNRVSGVGHIINVVLRFSCSIATGTADNG